VKPGAAVAVVVVVAALVGVVIGVALRGGGDDDGDAASASTTAAESEGDVSEDEGELTEDEPVAVFPVELASGDALRVVVDGLDTALGLGAGEDADTDAFHSLDPRAYVLEQDVDAGRLFLGTDRSGDDVEGIQFVAPSTGTWYVVVGGTSGEFDITTAVEPGEAFDGDEIDYLDYLAAYGDHVDFFCDEDFYGEDPEDVTNYGPTVCDPDELAGTLSGEFNGDFTNDFGTEDID
jgi:hypothetical protein